jgi:hypothetical protein
VAGSSEGVDEAEFCDALTRNLERGRAIVAVVGDGIREDIVPLAGLVQSHAGHRFTFALVELAVYKTPTSGARLVVPSVLAQTVLLERGVVRIADGLRYGQQLIVELPASGSPQASPDRPMSMAEDEFYEALGQRQPELPSALKSFLAKAEAFGGYADYQGGLNLKHAAIRGNPLNMGTITRGGIVDTEPSTWWGTRASARTYNERLAELIGGVLTERSEGTRFSLRTREGKMPRLSSLLPTNEEQWLRGMDEYVRDNLAAAAGE